MLQKFNKKSAQVEAFQWFIIDGAIGGVVSMNNPMTPEKYCIETPNGQVEVNNGDWIISGDVNGEIYPCDDALFHESFDIVV